MPETTSAIVPVSAAKACKDLPCKNCEFCAFALLPVATPHLESTLYIASMEIKSKGYPAGKQMSFRLFLDFDTLPYEDLLEKLHDWLSSYIHAHDLKIDKLAIRKVPILSVMTLAQADRAVSSSSSGSEDKGKVGFVQ